MAAFAEVVLDASALLAMLHGEPGAEAVIPLTQAAAMSAVNWAEVCRRSLSRGVELSGLRADVEALGVEIVPFAAEDAEDTAELVTLTRGQGLSLGDRACLALGRRLSLPVVTADRAWERLEAGVEVRMIR